MSDILEGRVYIARVGFVSTLNGPRSISTATILILRCNIFFDGDDIPLAVKVYWNRRTHGDKAPVRGDSILVRAYRKLSHHPMRFKPTTSTREDQTMAMSKDRVRFYIRTAYFETLAKRVKISEVMSKAFGISVTMADSWLHDAGLWVKCRPSQFARFLIYRNDANIVNGFMDLRAELVDGRTPDVYDALAEKAGVTRQAAKLVSLALSFDADDVEATQVGRFGGDLDVSKNPA